MRTRSRKGDAAPQSEIKEPQSDPEEDKNAKENLGPSQAVFPRRYGALAGLLLVAMRVLGGLTNIIPDCDETFNYWEPVHYLVYGFGQQTWEYSPLITLRSYAYLLPHVIVAKLLDVVLRLILRVPVSWAKVYVFYGLRIVLGLLSALAEALFLKAAATRLGPEVGLYTYMFLTFSSGLFQSSTAMLPSSAAGGFVMAVCAAWMQRQYPFATFLAVTAVLAVGLVLKPMSLATCSWGRTLMVCVYYYSNFGTFNVHFHQMLGWPFVALLFVPLAAHVWIDVTAQRGLVKGSVDVIRWGLCSMVLVLPLTVAIDTHYYRRPVLPALNIALYNLGRGPEGASDELYGVAPASYYVKNLLVNLNVVFPLALLLPVLAVTKALCTTGRIALRDQLIFLSPAVLWLGVMFSRPHKEERFLFPTYPLLALAAALSIRHTQVILAHVARLKIPRPLQRLVNLCQELLPVGLILLHALLSASRVIMISTGYGAPLSLYRQLATQQLQSTQTDNQVCVAGDWYRFPSSFFLPHSHTRLHYVKSSFTGQLPQPFQPVNGTWAAPLLPFNELNAEEPSRYVPLSSCHYLIEYFPPPDGAASEAVDRQVGRLGGTGEKGRWNVADTRPFLDAEASPSPYRAFWVPLIGHKRLVYGAYAVLQRQ